MKNFILLAGLLLAGGAVKAQIIPENVYQGSGYMIRLSNGDYKYQMIREVSNEVTLYNLNHSIYKRFTVPSLGTGYVFSNISFVSDALFDTNPSTLEYMASYGPAVYNSGIQYKTIVYSEFGTQLALLDSTSYVNIQNTPAGTKMLANKSTYNNATGAVTRNYTRVYTLGGQLALKAAIPNLPDGLGAYPNPAQSFINLPYTVPAGQIGSLKVYDMTGRLIEKYQVDSHVDRLEMSARDLRPGIYTYSVETSVGTSPGRKFVIQ